LNVFAIILEDRHVDVSVELFASRVDAESRFNEIVAEYDYTPDEPDECPDGWLLNATLSSEGDAVRMEELTVNAPLQMN